MIVEGREEENRSMKKVENHKLLQLESRMWIRQDKRQG